MGARDEAERAFALLDRATKAVEAIDMVFLAENVAYVEARARLALGDVDEAARSWRACATRRTHVAASLGGPVPP